VAVDLVLIHPPVALPCEPPAALGVIAAALRRAGLAVEVIDANLEAQEALVRAVGEERATTTAERRALRSRERALAQLRGPLAYASLDRYRAAVHDLGLALELASRPRSARVGLASYRDAELSPLASADLRAAAAAPERSPFFPCFEELAARVAGLAPRLVGLSLGYLHQALPALALAGALRARLPGTPIVAGGALLGCWRGRLDPGAFAPFVDELLFDEGLAALAARLAPGLRVVESAAPDYDGLPWERYLAPARVAPVATSRGCVWGRCSYCPEALAGPRFVPLAPAELPALLEGVWRDTRAGLLHLVDSTVPPAALAELARQRWSLRWYGFARFSAELARPGLADDLARSGCAMLQLGLESASPRVLARLRKGIAPAQASAALRRLADAGVAVYLYVMFGTPGEERDDALATLEFLVGHAAAIRCLNTSLLNLPLACAGEPRGVRLERVPLVDESRNDLTLYTGFRSAGGWDRRAARRFLERELARVPEVAAILRRTPPVFGANHAPFFDAKMVG
jgi:hypothetical protein